MKNNFLFKRDVSFQEVYFLGTVLNKILHVEDEEDIQEVAKMALEPISGLTVKSCSDAEDA